MHTHGWMHTHAHMRTHKYTNTHISCPVFSLPGMRHVAFLEGKKQKQQEQANTLLGHIWFTGSGHGAAAWKSEEQC